jgi:hypothetical protein
MPAKSHKLQDTAFDYLSKHKQPFGEKTYGMNDVFNQVNEYRKLTNLTNDELARVKEEKDIEKRRINEKQIRQLRNNYRRPRGFLNNQPSGNTLGNSNNITSKLGG